MLGSALANMFLKIGDEVSVIDIVREEECWRLQEYGIESKIEYIWKGTQDLSASDLDDLDIVIDCAIGFPDRPFGTDSPRTAIASNINPTVGLLEALRHFRIKPTVIYPSSFNSLYGNKGVYDEATRLNPTTIYGWTKSAVEQLYKTYYFSFGVPVVITRVGSSYGEMMRTDELVARLLISGLKRNSFSLRSPLASRIWTYLGDVIGAYETIISKSRHFTNNSFIERLKEKNFVMNIAGNVGDQILTNMEVATMISELMGEDLSVLESAAYEPGEMIEGNPVNFLINADWTRDFLGWTPKYSLRQGLQNTLDWFANNMEKVGTWNL